MFLFSLHGCGNDQASATRPDGGPTADVSPDAQEADAAIPADTHVWSDTGAADPGVVADAAIIVRDTANKSTDAADGPDRVDGGSTDQRLPGTPLSWFGVYQNDPRMSLQEMEDSFKVFKQYGVNHYFPFAASDGHANYPSASIADHEAIDYIQQALDLGAKYGVNIHIWHPAFMIKGAADTALERQLEQDGRICQDENGAIDPQSLNPVDPRNRALDLQVTEELVRRYPTAASFNLDYVRFPGSSYDFGPVSRKAFEDQQGATLADWPAAVQSGGRLEASFVQFRMRVITDHVRAVRTRIKGLSPGMKISAAVFPDSSDPTIIGQDWPRWASEGLVDLMMPMTYSTSLGNPELGTGGWFVACVKWQLAQTRGTTTWNLAGLGTANNDGDLNPASNMVAQVLAVLRMGADGFYVFANDTHFRSAFLPEFKRLVGGRPFLRISSPNGGDVLRAGAVKMLTWQEANDLAPRLRNVRILLSTDGGATYPTTLAASAPNTGSFAWTVPALDSKRCRVRVYDAEDDQVFDFSDADFTIAP